jgi:SAM-dependent methyltransferase
MEVMRIDIQDASTFAGIRHQFDTIVCVNVLEHAPDPLAALRNMRLALEEGGRVVIYVPQGPWLFSPLDTFLGHRFRYTREMLQGQLQSAGYVVESIAGFNRASVPAWYVNGRLLKRERLSRIQLKLFDMMVPILRRIDRWLPLPPLGLIAVARKRGDAATAAAT